MVRTRPFLTQKIKLDHLDKFVYIMRCSQTGQRKRNHSKVKNETKNAVE